MITEFKIYEIFGKRIKKRLKDFEKNKKNTPPASVIINNKKIIYNPFDREILNDTNIGKYVVLKDYPFDKNNVFIEDQKTLKTFIQNNVGKITKAMLGGGKTFYDIEYENIPNDLKTYFTQRAYNLEPKYLISNHLDYVSDNYDDCLTYITANNYNI